MRALLLLGGPRLAPDALLAGLAQLRAAGWDVDVVAWRALPDEARALGDEVLALTGPPLVLPAARERSGGSRLQRALAWRWRRLRRAYALRGVPALQKIVRKTGVGADAVAFSRRFHADADAVRLARRADVVVAVDRDSTLAAWKVARRRPDVTAVNGLGSLNSLL